MDRLTVQEQAAPPPVPVGYSISIEEAINDVRTSSRLEERYAWIQSFDAGRSEVHANYLYQDAWNRLDSLRAGILPETEPEQDAIEVIDADFRPLRTH